MAQEKSSNAFIYSFSYVLLSSILRHEYFKEPLNFDADIISIMRKMRFQRAISFQRWILYLHLINPYNQTIFNNNGKLYVQDDDFKQVIIYKNNHSFFLQDLFNNEYRIKRGFMPKHLL